MKTGVVWAISSVGMMIVTMILAYVDNRLFPSQMMAHHAAKGFPGTANGALYGNIVLMSATFFVIGAYSAQWTRGGVTAACVLGALIALYAFLSVYRYGLYDDAWAGAGKIHPAGVIAMIYTAGLVAAFILFYVFSSADRMDVWIIAVLLTLYLPLANHLVLNYFNEQVFPFVWCPHIFKEEHRPLIILVGGAVLVAVITVLKLLWPKAWL